MDYDSLLVIDDNGQKHKINFTLHTKRDSTKKYNNFVIGEVGGWLNFHNKQKFISSILSNGCNTVNVHHASCSNKNELFELVRNYANNNINNKQTRDEVRKQSIRHRKAIKYKEKHRIKNYNCIKVSKYTKKNIKKAIAKYGAYTIKARFDVFTRDEIIIRAYDISVLKHLYLNNSKTREYINISNYIDMTLLISDYTYAILDRNFIITNDTLCGYSIAIQKDDYQALHFIRTS